MRNNRKYLVPRKNLPASYDLSPSRARYCRISRRNTRIISIFDRKGFHIVQGFYHIWAESDTEFIDYFIVLYPHLLSFS